MNNIYIIILLLVIIVIIFLLNKNDNFYSLTEDITAKNIKASGNITASGNIDISGNINAKNITAFNDIGTWDGQGGFVATNSYMDVHGGPQNIRTAIGFGTIDNTTWGGDWAPQDLTITAKNVNTTGGINSQGIITAKKFVSTDGTSDLPLSREAIQNIASVYNNNNLRATNINASNNLAVTNTIYTRDLNVDNNLATKGTIYAQSDLNVDNNLAIKGNTFAQSDLYVEKNLSTKGTTFTNYLNVTKNIDANGVINANGGFKTPLDMTEINAEGGKIGGGKVVIDNGFSGNKVSCPNGYYVSGISQTNIASEFVPICRKLPGY
jgi:hypothetical protein